MSSVGFMANFNRGRRQNDLLIHDRKVRSARAVADEQNWVREEAVHARSEAELAELQLVVASLVRLLRKETVMADAKNVFDTYLRQTTSAERGTLASLRQELQVAPDKSTQMFAHIAELRLVVASMLRMLVDKDVVTAEQLQAIADEIDALDGQVDGKLDGKVGVDGTVAVSPPKVKSAIEQIADAVDERSDNA